MQETLIIFLNADEPGQPSWLVLGGDAQIKSIAVKGNSALLAGLAAQKEIIVLVPTEYINLLSVKMPQLSRARLREALPYALEDQLAEEVEKLHFALCYEQSETGRPVAVVAKNKMEEWLTLLREWQIVPHQLIPDIFAVPFEPEAWHLTAVHNKALVRMAQYQGFACAAANLNTLLKAALVGRDLPPSILFITHVDGEMTVSPSTFNTREVKMSLNDWYAQAAYVVKHQPVINLLQGPYQAKKRPIIKINKLRQGMFILIFAWISILLLTPTISYFILKSRANALKQQITAVYQSHFPKEKLVSPKAKLQDKWQSLTTRGSGKLFDLLYIVSKAATNSSAIQLKRLDFQQNQMTLQFNAASSAVYTAFTDSLRQQGLQVKEQGVNIENNHLAAMIVVE